MLVAATLMVVAATLLNLSGPFLMGVAIASSSAFLTPIGHHNNTLVMGPGGYKFGDYWRVGLPMQVLLIAVAVPALIWFWPF